MQVCHFLTVCLLLRLVEELQAQNQNGPCPEGSIQPLDQNEGRVKYCHNGRPRFVCSHGWSNEEATVVCRQMGLPTQGATLISGGELITSEVLSQVLLTDPQCFGNEADLIGCLNPIPPQETLLINCPYAAVRCGNPPPGQPCTPEGSVWFQRRLMQTQGGGMQEEWRAMFCLNGNPMDVCNMGWGTEEATVACRQLGLPTEGATVIDDGELITANAAPRAVFYDPQCSGEEPEIAGCPNVVPENGLLVGCPYAAVSCDEGSTCTEEEIELEESGRLEICVEGELRPVCSSGWTDDAAGIVCRQLEFASAGELEFGGFIFTEEEAARAVLTEVDCAGTEQLIAECVTPVLTATGQTLVGCPYVTISCEDETPDIGEFQCLDVREGYLPFLFLGETPGVDLQLMMSLTEDNATSPPIVVPGGIPFGDCVHNVIYVSTDGLFSFSEPYTECCPRPFPLEDDVYIVAPFWSDVDIRLEGQVLYEVHSWSNPDSRSLLTEVSSLLGEQAGSDINGTWMLVAKWEAVHPYPHGNGNTPSDFLLRVNTFQGVIITDEDNQTFAVFTYECGLLEWSDTPASLNQHAVIGYTAPGGFYGNHDLSGTSDVTSVSCAACPSSIWSNVVYDLTTATALIPDGIGPLEPAERCGMNESGVDISSFGRCEPFISGSEFCDSLFENTDLYVYIPDSWQPIEQQDLHDVIREHFAAINNADLNNDPACMQMVLGVVCRYYYIPCVTVSDPVDADPAFLPISVCPEECDFVQNKCRQLWFLVQSLSTISLPQLDFINCSNPDAAIEPLPNCCVDAGVTVTVIGPTPTILAQDPTVAPSTIGDNTAIITGVTIGATAVFVLMVVVIVCVVLKRKRKKIEDSRALTLANFHGFSDDGAIEGRGTSRNPYTQTPSPFTNTPKPLTRQNTTSLEYLEQLEASELMLIPKDDIRLLDSIGQGEFGIVYKGHLLDSKTSRRKSFAVDLVAVKTLKGFFDESHAKDILDESAKMVSFNHPHVLGLIGVCVDAGPAPYLVMPFMANGSLLSYLKANRQSLVLPQDEDQENVTETQKKTMDMCIQIAKGMEYLAHKKFVHRDLAARNCMIDTNFVIKVADFGLSEDVYERNYFKQGQSAVKLPIKWMALESTTDGVFSEKTDVWSFGVTCWEIYSGGKTPYAGVDPISLIELLEAGRRLDKPMNAACSDEMFSVVASCWSAEPSKRPLFTNLVATISKLLAPLADYMDFTALSAEHEI